MDSTRDASAPVDLKTFLQRHGSRLPCTVKVVEGFCGTNAEDTLEGGEILVIYKVEKQNTIMALDQLNQEICVPRNTKNKVQLLPFQHHGEHKKVRHLFNAHQTQYFRVLEDLVSLQISSETTLELLSDQPFPNFAKCKVVDLYDSREVLLPLELEGRFQPLLDAREYYLEEVLAQYQLPVNVRFVLTSRANDACLSNPLPSLENIHLEHEAEVKMIFAASVDDPLSLNLFPRTLDINVSFGFKVTADASKKIKECRQTLAASERTLKRLDIIASNSFYFKVCPVRRFNYESLQPPSISISQTTKERKAELLSKAKQNKTAEQTAPNRETSTMLRHAQCLQPQSKPGWLSEEHAADYENCETDERVKNFVTPEARKAVEESTEAVPDLPPKVSTKTSGSTTPKDPTRANEQSPRPVPKPRKRLNLAKKRNQENVNSSVSQAAQSQDTNLPEWTGPFSGDDAVDICPELPPRPEFLKLRSIEDKEDDDESRGEPPPPLPPRCPGPNQFGFPAYLVVDVTDWRAVDEKAFRPNTIEDEVLYSYAKDDGHVFRQDSVRHLDLSLMYPPDETEPYSDMKSPVVNGISYVDMERHEKMEVDGRGSGRENSHRKDFLQPDETGTSEELENSQLLEAGRENGDEATKHLEEESSDEDYPYEEIEEKHESPQRKNQSKGNAANQGKAKVQRPSNNPRIKATQGSFDARPRWAAMATNSQLLEAGRENGDEATKHLEEESSDEDYPYEEIEEKHESPQRKNQSKGNAANQEKAKVERPSNNPRIKATQGSFDARPRWAAMATCPINKKGIIISGRRDEDWMDFRDIEHFLKLRKQLSEALAKKADLEKQVAVTGQSLAVESQTQQSPASDHTGNASAHMDKADSLDENHNRLDSFGGFCNHSQRGTQAATRSESLSLYRGEGHKTEMQKNSSLSLLEADDFENREPSLPSLSSVAPKKVVPGNVTYYQKCSLTSVEERRDSDDDDDYEECHDREYVNQETGVSYSFKDVSSENEFHDHYMNVEKRQQSGNDKEDAEHGLSSIYYNTVELETHRDGRPLTSLYLQLDNPHDEEENVYLNVDAQESDTGFEMTKADGNQTVTQVKAIVAEKDTFTMKKAACEGPPNAVGCIKEPPPLPPKKTGLFVG